MKATLPPPPRQRGTIAVLFGLTLIMLLAAGGLVLDLGHLYILKSELQNAADSGALAGAKELNLSAAGITSATNAAVAFANKNKFNFTDAVAITAADVSFASQPNPSSWSTVGEALANPGDKSFIRVLAPSGALPTYLMRVAGVDTLQTNGDAVAGRFVVDITPIGVCAIDPANRTSVRATTAPVENELVEFGFRRGLGYDVLKMANIAGTADPMLINPTDSPPSACQPSHSSANFMAPFLCQGNSAVANNTNEVYANTGISAGPVEKALNSRFGDYSGSACAPASAPPDSNIREYKYNDLLGGAPPAWMSPVQSQQTLPFNSTTGLPTVPGSSANWGAIWSYSRAVRATGTAPNYDAGTPFEVADWSRLYPLAPTALPAYPSGSTGSPYSQTSGQFHQTQSVNPAEAKRRQLNLAIIDCRTVGSGAMSCKKVPVLGVGKFFMQRRIAMTGSDKRFDVEFAGLIEPVPNAEIKLYR